MANTERLQRLAALGDADAAAEVIRWRERQGEAWCSAPYHINEPMLSDPEDKRVSDMGAWIKQRMLDSGVDVAWWRSTGIFFSQHYGGHYFAALVKHIDIEHRTYTILLDCDGPCLLSDGSAGRMPATRCNYDAVIPGATWRAKVCAVA